MIEIKPQGSYFETDSEGFLINPTSMEKLQSKWKGVVDDVIGHYKEKYGERLTHVYVRGSVAKGEAIEDVSDVDTFAYVDIPKDEIKHGLHTEKADALKKKYPFVDDIEYGVEPTPKEIIGSDALMLNQSLCVFGTPLKVPKLKPGKDTILHVPNIHERVKYLDEFFSKEQPPEEIESACVWIMKGLLRSGCELVMERSGKYTRDLYRCYELFAEYYPEKKEDMYEVLDLALNPIQDVKRIKSIKHTMAEWLSGEYKRLYS